VNTRYNLKPLDILTSRVSVDSNSTLVNRGGAEDDIHLLETAAFRLWDESVYRWRSTFEESIRGPRSQRKDHHSSNVYSRKHEENLVVKLRDHVRRNL